MRFPPSDAIAVAVAAPSRVWPSTEAERKANKCAGSNCSENRGRGATPDMVLEPKRTHKRIHSEAHNAPHLPYDSKDLACLPAGATVEEREQNCRVMEEKKKQVEKALEHPETLPFGESQQLANKRAKYLAKQIAKEERIISKEKEKEKKRAMQD